MPRCTFCREEVVVTDRVGRTEACHKCGRDLHCCYQCLFYDASAHNECREPQADRVIDKEKSNFCDYFVFEPQASHARELKKESLRKLEGLFRKK